MAVMLCMQTTDSLTVYTVSGADGTITLDF